MIEIREAVSDSDIAAARALMRAYQALPDIGECAVGFEEEIVTLPGRYAPPTGALLLAVRDGVAVGCVGLRRMSDGRAEMKRLFVMDAARGTGAGRALVEALIQRARALGYTKLFLDTLPWMTRAHALYRALGFVQVDKPADCCHTTALAFELTL